MCGAFSPDSPARGPFPGAACSDCPGNAPFDCARSLFVYEGRVGDAIRAAKYRGAAWGAPAVAARLWAAIRGEWSDRFPAGFRPTIVPVPIRPAKYFRRGFNLPALIGRPLGRLAGWPFDPLLLRRCGGERRPQAGLPLAERGDNVRGAFRVAPGRRVPGEALLLDDVYTSGATVAACARALKTAGSEHIVVLTVARAVA